MTRMKDQARVELLHMHTRLVMIGIRGSEV